MNRNLLPVPPLEGYRSGYTILPDGSVHFAIEAREARWVGVAGTFSDWKPVPLTPRPTGRWEAIIPPPGRGIHHYKFVVDGRWAPDPSHPMGEPDGFGSYNSAFGISLGEPLAAGGFRVLSLNLHSYQEPDPLQKLRQVAYGMVAMGVNVALLQEVGEHIYRPDERPNAGEVIRQAMESITGRPWFHEWRESHAGFGMYREGVSILSDSLPRDVEEFRLSGGRYARNALAAVVKAGGVEVRVCTVHLSWPSGGGDSEAAALLRGLNASVPSGIVADVIAGDFNADATDETIRHMLTARYRDAGAVAGDTGLTVLMQRWQGAAVVPDPSGELFARIDYQFWKETAARRGNIRACRRIFNRNVVGGVYLPRVSDHVGLLGVYDLPAN